MFLLSFLVAYVWPKKTFTIVLRNLEIWRNISRCRCDWVSPLNQCIVTLVQSTLKMYAECSEMLVFTVETTVLQTQKNTCMH